MPDFIPGLELAGLFYQETVRPILNRYFPNLRYAAALLGNGSEILGYDTAQSTDHHWGPRVQLFLSEVDLAAYAEPIVETLRAHLPRRFRGYSTNYREIPGEPGVMAFDDSEDGPLNHRVSVNTVGAFFAQQLGVHPDQPLTLVDWLTIPEQRLLTVTSGRVYRDDTGELTAAREKFGYYPHDVWLYLLANQWRRIAQEEAFVGRTGDVGDDLGSRLLAARLVRDLMRLAFLMERRYAPYAKWFGTAFSRLDIAPTLTPIFTRALSADNWRERETHLSTAYETMAHKHIQLGLTEPMPVEVSPFHSRPYLVIHGDAFADTLLAAVQDPDVRALPPYLGGVDQFADSTDVLSQPGRFRALGTLFRSDER